MVFRGSVPQDRPRGATWFVRSSQLRRAREQLVTPHHAKSAPEGAFAIAPGSAGTRTTYEWRVTTGIPLLVGASSSDTTRTLDLMSFLKLVPGARGGDARRRLVGAIREAYTENVARYAPDDIGDNNTTFGVSVTHNLRFLAEHAIEGLAGFAAHRPRNSFVLQIDGRYDLFFYKAPPGITSVHAMRFDESELRLEIARVNAAQLQLDLEAAVSDETSFADVRLPRHAVIVHFGDPESGFQSATIGAPYRTLDGGCEWAWEEPFDESDEGIDGGGEDSPEEDGGGFGLQMRRGAEAEDQSNETEEDST